ncbi:MAG: asparagine synthase (glutamine-hydrolyzing) [Clostridia bacterium]|nr:asparagine synthase (glutamine-hydrolyzing) [Clostridia bacterium]
MSGITGVVNLRRKIDDEIENIRKMTQAISHRGKNSQKIKNSGFGVFGAVASDVCEDKSFQIPFSMRSSDAEFVICFDGLIYNSEEVKEKLKTGNVSDAELVLAAYIKLGAGCLHCLNGIFAFSIWNSKNNELFLARDRFGIKPLYYTLSGDSLIFASEIKGLLCHPSVPAIIDRQGVCEVLGLGPAHTQGTGVFKGIFEIKPACCATFNSKGFNQSKYWNLVSKRYDASFEECLTDVKELTQKAISSQVDEKGRDLCFFLSGGLDSSIITAMAAEKSESPINTFSLKYVGNDEFFVPNQYQPETDDYYIQIMSDTFGTRHTTITVDNDALFDLLYDAMKARDLPGMADVDSSLYFLCKEMGKDFDGAVSGECADEVFGGYPWFHRKEDFDANIFPWSKNVELRKNLVSPDIMSSDTISDYIYSKYRESINSCPVCRDDNAEEKRRREISHLNLNWFMYTLGARSERIGMNSGLEIRMPFCDYKLVEYLWNVPWDYKAYNDREKGLLRMCFSDLLPEEVLWRKKSPFPKTHNPEYEVMVRNRLAEILDDKNSPVWGIVNEKHIRNLLSERANYGSPWFGQLMALPQLYAYIIQIDMWLKEYKIKVQV